MSSPCENCGYSNEITVCNECDLYKGEYIKKSVLEDIKAEVKQWYWQANKQALAKDPCVVDAMVNLFIKTIDKYY